MEDKILIYIAGNPDAYPLEYYDADSQTYQGVIPQLLADFSAQSAYELVYYSPGPEDRREHMAKNRQVDLLSGYTQEELPAGSTAIPLFSFLRQGESVTLCLSPTQTASEELCAALEDYFSALPQQTVTGMLVETAAQPQPATGLWLAVGGLGLAVLLLAAALLTVVLRNRRRLRDAQQQRERDELTGLGNLDYLERYAPQVVQEKNRVLYHLICFSLDTEQLRQQAGNDTCSELLRYCALLLSQHAAHTDVLARVSEDSFVLLKMSGDSQQVLPLVEEILRQLRAYPQVHGRAFQVHAAAGIYPLKLGDWDWEEMLFHAQQQARTARREQKDYILFSPGVLQTIQTEQALRASVEGALARQEFLLYVQFYVDARTHRIMGGEALSRWLHPERGLLTPSVFVPLLEREGLIDRLDYHSLRGSCELLQMLFDRGIKNFFLSCNFSRDTFASPDFVEQCRAILDAFHFPRELLIFELTESVLGQKADAIRANMLALKDYGVRIALDDFGQGFTSFTDLQQYPVDGIKLDKELVDNVLNQTGNSILRAMIQVAHELDLTILAEGVETAEQAQALQDIHCDVIQGFRFYAPIPEEEASDILLRQARLAAPSTP